MKQLIKIGLLITFLNQLVSANSEGPQVDWEDAIRQGTIIVAGNFTGAVGYQLWLYEDLFTEQGERYSETRVIGVYDFAVQEILDGEIDSHVLPITLPGGELSGYYTASKVQLPNSSQQVVLSLRANSAAAARDIFAYNIAHLHIKPVTTAAELDEFREQISTLRQPAPQHPDQLLEASMADINFSEQAHYQEPQETVDNITGEVPDPNPYVEALYESSLEAISVPVFDGAAINNNSPTGSKLKNDPQTSVKTAMTSSQKQLLELTETSVSNERPKPTLAKQNGASTPDQHRDYGLYFFAILIALLGCWLLRKQWLTS